MPIVVQLLFAATLAAATPGTSPQSAPDPTPPVAGSEAAAPPKDDKVICRTITPTGSRLGGSRVCRTAQQWRDLQHNNQQTISDMQRHGGSERIPGT